MIAQCARTSSTPTPTHARTHAHAQKSHARVHSHPYPNVEENKPTGRMLPAPHPRGPRTRPRMLVSQERTIATNGHNHWIPPQPRHLAAQTANRTIPSPALPSKSIMIRAHQTRSRPSSPASTTTNRHNLLRLSSFPATDRHTTRAHTTSPRMPRHGHT